MLNNAVLTLCSATRSNGLIVCVNRKSPAKVLTCRKGSIYYRTLYSGIAISADFSFFLALIAVQIEDGNIPLTAVEHSSLEACD